MKTNKHSKKKKENEQESKRTRKKTFRQRKTKEAEGEEVWIEWFKKASLVELEPRTFKTESFAKTAETRDLNKMKKIQ